MKVGGVKTFTATGNYVEEKLTLWRQYGHENCRT